MKTLYARTLTVNKIDNKQAREFVETNHRDSCPKNIKDMISYCLHEGQDIYAVAIFGNPRTSQKQTKYTKELVRLAFKTNVRIVGGASKLLKHVMNSNIFYDIFTYQDTTGKNTDVYELSGFTFVKQDARKEYLVKDGYTLKTANREQKYGIAYVVQYGPDRILGTSLGQETGKTNKQLFIECGYHSEYTTGDKLYEWFNPNWTHFVYKTTSIDNTPGYYIGVHSIPVKDASVETCTNYDNYVGSGKGKFDNWKHAKEITGGLKKEILGIYATRCAAFKAEHKLLGDKYTTDINCKNTINGGRGSARKSTGGYSVIEGVNDFATKHPELLSEWSNTNIIKSSNISYGSKQVVDWECEHGHTWNASVVSRHNGNGCPECARLARQSTVPLIKGVNDLSQYENLKSEWSDKNTIDYDTVFKSSNKKAIWKCNTCGGEWEATINNRTKGHGCPYCAGRKVLIGFNDLLSQKPDIAKDWSDDNDINPDEVTVHSNKKVKWICEKHNHTYIASVNDRSNGTGCPVDAGKVVIKGINDLATNHPQLALEWSDKNVLTPYEVTSKSSKKVIWKCEHGHEWEATISNRANGSKCPYCSGKRILKGYNDLVTLRPDIMLDWDYDKNEVDPTTIGTGNKTKVYWKCHQCGHTWESSVSNRTNRGTQCPNHKHH